MLNNKVIMLEEIKDFYVVKHNNLVEAYYSLSCIHQKMVLLLASLVKPTDKIFQEVTFKAKDLMSVLGVSAKNYAYLKKQTNTLAGNVIEMVLNDGKELRQAPWLSYANYSKDGKDIIVKFKLNEAIQPFVIQLTGHFTKYRLSAVMTLSSSYSIRLYELLIQYLKVGERVIELSKLKRMLSIDENKHQRYPDFRRHVLMQAQKELSEKSDIDFTFEPIKKGKAVESVKFIIKRNHNYIKDCAKKNDLSTLELLNKFNSDKSPLDDLAVDYDDEFSNIIMNNISDNTDDELQKVLQSSFGFRSDEILKLVDKYGKELLWEKYHYYHYKKKDIKNPTAWYINAVIKDYSTADMKQGNTIDHVPINPKAERLADLTQELHDLNMQANSLNNELKSPVCKYSVALKEQYQRELKETQSMIQSVQSEIVELGGA
jgi:plasmid replication initiation protein